MTESKALARRRSARLAVPCTLDELYNELLAEHGFEQRSPTHGDGTTIPEGKYIAKTADGFVVWVPPDPQRSVGNSLLPRPVYVRAIAGSAGETRVEVRRGLAVDPGTIAGTVTIATFAAAVAAGASHMMPLAIVALPLSFLFAVTWVVIRHQQGIAAERAEAAWNAITPILAAYAERSRDADPYRG